jgi:hypothetical protein
MNNKILFSLFLLLSIFSQSQAQPKGEDIARSAVAAIRGAWHGIGGPAVGLLEPLVLVLRELVDAFKYFEKHRNEVAKIVQEYSPTERAAFTLGVAVTCHVFMRLFYQALVDRRYGVAAWLATPALAAGTAALGTAQGLIYHDKEDRRR